MKTALIFGSSGLIGKNILDLILGSNKYEKIKLFVRINPDLNDSRIEIIKSDFINFDEIKNKIVGDDCFFCIGTIRSSTPNEEEYTRIEYDIPVTIAKIAKSNSVNNFTYVSSIGASIKASSLYLKNKGLVEQELNEMNFTKLSIIRPSILLGKRKYFRLGETIGQYGMLTFSPLMHGRIKKYRPIKAIDVAKSIIKITENNYNKVIFESDELELISKS